MGGRVLQVDDLVQPGAKQILLAPVSSAAPSDPRRPHRSKQEAAPSGRPTQSLKGLFFCTRAIGYYPSAQLLRFCLLSTLEIIVGLHKEKPSSAAELLRGPGRRHFEAEGFGGLEVDRHFKLDRALDGKRTRFLTL
jgi:hypothetical protein